MGAWVIGHMKSWGNDASSAAGSPDGGAAGGANDGSGAADGAAAAGAAATAGAGAPSGSIVRRRQVWHSHVVTPSSS